jgi:hypothetical protein
MHCCEVLCKAKPSHMDSFVLLQVLLISTPLPVSRGRIAHKSPTRLIAMIILLELVLLSVVLRRTLGRLSFGSLSLSLLLYFGSVVLISWTK